MGCGASALDNRPVNVLLTARVEPYHHVNGSAFYGYDYRKLAQFQHLMHSLSQLYPGKAIKLVSQMNSGPFARPSNDVFTLDNWVQNMFDIGAPVQYLIVVIDEYPPKDAVLVRSVSYSMFDPMVSMGQQWGLLNSKRIHVFTVQNQLYAVYQNNVTKLSGGTALPRTYYHSIEASELALNVFSSSNCWPASPHVYLPIKLVQTLCQMRVRQGPSIDILYEGKVYPLKNGSWADADQFRRVITNVTQMCAQSPELHMLQYAPGEEGLLKRVWIKLILESPHVVNIPCNKMLLEVTGTRFNALDDRLALPIVLDAAAYTASPTITFQQRFSSTNICAFVAKQQQQLTMTEEKERASNDSSALPMLTFRGQEYSAIPLEAKDVSVTLVPDNGILPWVTQDSQNGFVWNGQTFSVPIELLRDYFLYY